MIPSFVIIGTMKGGTTSLHHYLKAHPKIGMPEKKKETNFFVPPGQKPSTYERGFDWYRSLYPEGAEVYGEASPNYTKRHLWGDGTARLLHDVNPAVKLLYLLRDPIDRFVSHYTHNVVSRREARSLSEAVRDPESAYFMTSCYHYQLQPYLQHFSLDQFLFLPSNTLRNDKEATLQRIFQFIGVESFASDAFEKSHHVGTKKQVKSALELKVKDPRLFRVLQRVLPERFTKRRPVERPRITDEDVRHLAERFAPDVERLRELTGLSFTEWSHAYPRVEGRS